MSPIFATCTKVLFNLLILFLVYKNIRGNKTWMLFGVYVVAITFLNDKSYIHTAIVLISTSLLFSVSAYFLNFWNDKMKDVKSLYWIFMAGQFVIGVFHLFIDETSFMGL